MQGKRLTLTLWSPLAYEEHSMTMLLMTKLPTTKKRLPSLVTVEERYGVVREHNRRHLGKALTPCEADILRLIAVGETNKSMAGILNRSIKTVEKHRTNMMRKVGLYCIADLVHYALATGVCGNKFGGNK